MTAGAGEHLVLDHSRHIPLHFMRDLRGGQRQARPAWSNANLTHLTVKPRLL